jgi:hypothetical protein
MPERESAGAGAYSGLGFVLELPTPGDLTPDRRRPDG